MDRPATKTHSRNSNIVYGRRDAAVDHLHCRMASLGTVNEESRTVNATLVTETPVPMYDWRSDRMFDEVLLASGGSWRPHVPLLDSHNRFSSEAVLGSITNQRQGETAWTGELSFVRGDEEVDKIWLRVSQGHLRGVSAGYRYDINDVITIAPYESRVVNGRTYRARSIEMRLVTKWRGHEVSVTPVQADEASQTRSDKKNWPACYEVEDGFRLLGGKPNSTSGNRSKPVGYLAFLTSLGLVANANESQIREFHNGLTGDDRTRADELLVEHQRSLSQERTASQSATTSSTAAAPVNPPSTAGAVADPIIQAQAAERERIQQIRALALDVPSEIVDRAIDQNWDLARVRSEFVSARPARSEPAQSDQTSRPGPAIHVGADGGPSLRTLQAALLMNRGYDLDDPMFQHRSVQAGFRRTQADWICEQGRALAGQRQGNDEHARAFDDAYRFRNMPLVDMCREVLRLENQPHSGYDYRDLVTRALSAPTAYLLFTTSFNAELLDGYTTTPDTTMEWTSETDLPNWQPAERHQKGLVSRLRRKSRTAAPEQSTFASTKEIIRVYTYSERFEMTREDVFDDRLGGLDGTPLDLGVAAGELRPDLVYSTLLSNPNMGDGNAIFGAISGGINNTTASMSFDAASLDSVKSKMHTQTNGGRLIAERASHWIVPESKAWTARRVIGSEEDRTTTADVDRGTMNPAKNAFSVVAEPRLDAGVVNPTNDTTVAGAPTSWYLAARGGRKGIQVAYLRADGRGPVTEPYNLTEGRIGMGWTVEMVVGVAAIGRAGLARATA